MKTKTSPKNLQPSTCTLQHGWSALRPNVNHLPKSHDDIAGDYFALRRNFVGKKWVFSEGRNPFNDASHCDIAWAGALASHVHVNNKPVLTARVG